MRTPEEVAADFHGRRSGILRALVDEQDAFFEACNPAAENLCLYGNQDGTWEVALPAEVRCDAFEQLDTASTVRRASIIWT